MKAALEELARFPGVWRGGALESAPREVVPTGHAALDRELPGGGWPIGVLSEVLHDEAGIGEVGFLAGTLAAGSQGGKLVAWIAPPHLPYAPALAQAGIALEHCLVLRPVHREDALWAAEQCLRSGACASLLLWLPKAGDSRSRAGEYAWLRRLQLAAQAGRSMAVIFRSRAGAALSTPAHLRVSLSHEEGHLALRIPKRRGPPLLEALRLEAGWRSHMPQPSSSPLAEPVPAAASCLPRIAA
jgi:cell division inhibitor SulA/protein ImuA